MDKEQLEALYEMVGESLKDALTNINIELADLRDKRDKLTHAWKAHDWDYLVNAGYLYKSLVDEMLKLEREAAELKGFSGCKCR